MNQVDILKWFLTAGITDCVGESPIDRFQSVLVQAKERTTRLMNQSVQKFKNQPVQSQSHILTTNDTSFMTQAEALSKSATDMASLKIALNQFEGCSLKKTAAHTLDGMGKEDRPTVLCLIDAPKSDDEKAGRLASGDLGLLLLKMLQAIQLNCATNTYVAPIIPWRLPGDRKPTDTEIALCLPFLRRRIELLCPRFMLLFGSLPTKTLLGIDSIPKARQQTLSYQMPNGIPIPVVATFGPDSVRTKGQAYRANAWADLQKLQKMINEQK